MVIFLHVRRNGHAFEKVIDERCHHHLGHWGAVTYGYGVEASVIGLQPDHQLPIFFYDLPGQAHRRLTAMWPVSVRDIWVLLRLKRVRESSASSRFMDRVRAGCEV